MANKLIVPARPGAGSLLFPTKTYGVPQHRFPKLRIGSGERDVLSQYITPLTVQQYITNLYLYTLLRIPTSTELADAVAALTLGCSTGTILESTKDLIDTLFGSAFYTSRSRSNAEYVDDLFLAVLGREQLDHPLWVNSVGGVVGPNGAWVKSAATAWDNSGAASSLPIPFNTSGHIKAIMGAMTVVLALMYSQDPLADQDGTGFRAAYGIQCNVNSWQASYILGMTGPTAITTCQPGDEFSLYVNGTAVEFRKGSTVLSVPGIPAVTADLYGAVVGFSQGAGILSSEMSPAPAGDGSYFVDALNGASLTRQQVRDAFNYGEDHTIRISSFCKRVNVTTGQIWPRRV